MRAAMAVLIVGLGSLIALPAAAQQGVVPQAPQPQQPGVQIRSTAPAPAERPARVVAPPLHYETTRPPDADYYVHGGTKVEHDPAFIEPMAARYETPNGSGQYGLSGWTSPNAPIGSEATLAREVSGWFALGFSFTWDGPPAPKSRPPR